MDPGENGKWRRQKLGEITVAFRSPVFLCPARGVGEHMLVYAKGLRTDVPESFGIFFSNHRVLGAGCHDTTKGAFTPSCL